jgi:hypothetical protein
MQHDFNILPCRKTLQALCPTSIHKHNNVFLKSTTTSNSQCATHHVLQNGHSEMRQTKVLLPRPGTTPQVLCPALEDTTMCPKITIKETLQPTMLHMPSISCHVSTSFAFVHTRHENITVASGYTRHMAEHTQHRPILSHEIIICPRAHSP